MTDVWMNESEASTHSLRHMDVDDEALPISTQVRTPKRILYVPDPTRYATKIQSTTAVSWCIGQISESEREKVKGLDGLAIHYKPKSRKQGDMFPYNVAIQEWVCDRCYFSTFMLTSHFQ
jgi:hypothetical protein